MHDGVNVMALEDFVESGGIAEVGLIENGLRGDGGALALAEVIEGDDLNAGGDEEFRADAADIACGTGDQNVQREPLLGFCHAGSCADTRENGMVLA